MYHQLNSRITIGQSRDQRRLDTFGSSANLSTRVGGGTNAQAARVTRGRDPPGQSCVYITPGDHRKETYRLSTFAKFPANTVNIYDLAGAGFYYTGFKDQAKCFSCGTNVQGWEITDSPFDSVWHEVDCPMAQGQDLRNVESDTTSFRKIFKHLCQPTVHGGKNTMLLKSLDAPVATNQVPSNTAHATQSVGKFGDLNENLPKLTLAQVPDLEHKALLATLDLTRESERRKTFAKWPSYPAPYLPRTLAKEGFFYLGNLDRAQCFSCSGGIQKPIIFSCVIHFISIALALQSLEVQNIHNASFAGVLRNWAPSDDVRQQHKTHFANCRFHSGRDPRNLEMTESQRKEADDIEMLKLSSLLPSGDVSEPPNPSLAEQNHLELYLPCDDPHNPSMMSLQSRIDSFRGWPAAKTKATPQQLARAGLYYLGETDKTKCFYCNGGLQNWDYNDEPWTEHAKWFPGCAFINRQKGTGFVQHLLETHPNLNRPSIRNGISPKDVPSFQPNASHGNCAKEVGLVRMVVEQAPMVINAAAREPQICPENSNADTALLNTLKQKEESMLCKQCKVKKADNVLLPCGHLIACSVCAPAMKKCIHCKTKVSQSVKTYRA